MCISYTKMSECCNIFKVAEHYSHFYYLIDSLIRTAGKRTPKAYFAFL